MRAEQRQTCHGVHGSKIQLSDSTAEGEDGAPGTCSRDPPGLRLMCRKLLSMGCQGEKAEMGHRVCPAWERMCRKTHCGCARTLVATAEEDQVPSERRVVSLHCMPIGQSSMHAFVAHPASSVHACKAHLQSSECVCLHCTLPKQCVRLHGTSGQSSEHAPCFCAPTTPTVHASPQASLMRHAR